LSTGNRLSPRIPVIVNNRDLEVQNLLLDLCRLGASEIHLIDNASTYPPLVSWLNSAPTHLVRPTPRPDGSYDNVKLSIWRSAENLGPRAACRVANVARGSWERLGITHYATTDSDLDLSSVPDNALQLFAQASADFTTAYGQCTRVGVALSLDLPDVPAARLARTNEQSYWDGRRQISWSPPAPAWRGGPVTMLFAPIDTTLAVIPLDPAWNGDYEPAYRVAGPYTAKHRPWYHDDSNRPADFRHYLAHANPAGTLYTAEEKARTR
jgi:hypothetical protein